MIISRALIGACVFGVMVSSAAAQVVERPERSTNVPPERSTKELTFQGSLLGGFDDNLVPPAGGDIFAPYPSGYTGYGESTLRYRAGNEFRFFEASGGPFMNTYRNVGVGPTYGGMQQVRARTTIGRRTDLNVNQHFRYAPRFSLGLFGAVQPDGAIDTIDTNTTSALNESGSWLGGGSVGVTERFTRRTTVEGTYAFDKQVYHDDTGFDSRNHVVTVGMSHMFGRWTGLRTSYQHADNEYLNLAGLIPILTRTADVGFTYLKQLSPSRQLSISGSGGVSRIDTMEYVTRAPEVYWTPAAFGAFRMDIGRTWSIEGDYRRSTTVLQGASPQPFTSHTAQFVAAGDLKRWLEGLVSVGYANGFSNLMFPGTENGTYNGYTATGQVSFKLSPNWSSVLGLTHFQYRLNDSASRTLGVSSRLQRNAVRAGVAWSLPIYRRN